MFMTCHRFQGILLPARLIMLVFWLCLAPVSAPSAAPRDELLCLVPDDVGFCLVVQESHQ